MICALSPPSISASLKEDRAGGFGVKTGFAVYLGFWIMVRYLCVAN